jgi:hypothetical protein
MASSRRAHQVVKWAAKCEESGLPLLHNINKCQSNPNKEEGATSFPWAATSRGRHLSKRGAPPFPHAQIKKICNQSTPNQVYLVPFDLLIDFALSLLQICPPLFFFYFDLADFIELKCLFWVFEGKIKI